MWHSTTTGSSSMQGWFWVWWLGEWGGNKHPLSYWVEAEGVRRMECRNTCQCCTLHHQRPSRAPFVWRQSFLFKVAVTPHSGLMAGFPVGHCWEAAAGGGGGVTWHDICLCI